MQACVKFLNCRIKACPLVICVVFLVFAFTNFYLFYTLYKSQQASKAIRSTAWPAEVVALLRKDFHLVKDEWRLRAESSKLSELNCSVLQQVQYKEFVALGWTKSTNHVVVEGKDMAIKYVNPHGHDVSICINREQGALYDCYMKAASKFIHEIVRMKILEHPNIIKLLGYCIPEVPDIDEGKWISIITELGEPINVIKLLLMTWDERLKISLELARLIHHLSNSRLGPVALNDFRRQQFVFVRGDLKLVDLDDIGINDPYCDKHPCCINSLNQTNCVVCTSHICSGFNEKLNIISTGKHFIKHILPYEVPSELKFLVSEINKAYEKAAWTTKKFLRKTEDLTRLYMKGLHHNSTL